MVNEPRNIDEFFKQSLTNAEMPAFNGSWKVVKGKVALKSFFRFNPYKINAYYLVPIVVATFASFVYFTENPTFPFLQDIEQDIRVEMPQFNYDNNISTPVVSERVKQVNTTKYTEGQVIIERETVVDMEMTAETVELSLLLETQKSTVKEITQITEAPSELKLNIEVPELSDNVDTTNNEVIETIAKKKKKSRKKRRPIKMH